MILDLLLDSLLPALGNKRRARRLLDRGEPCEGVIDAVRVTTRAESADLWDYGIEIKGERYGLRQWLEPERGRATLGAKVALLRLDREALIDWPRTLALLGSNGAAGSHSVDGWKPLRDPPALGLTGVTLEQLRRRAG